MERRFFLKAVALTGVASTLKMVDGFEVLPQKGSNGYDLVAVMGGEPDQMFRRAITEMGGIGKYVKPGNKVTIKPNIGWDRIPELAATTNPVLVSEIIKQCLKAGAKEVI